MTMPERIWAVNYYGHQKWTNSFHDSIGQAAEYVRADAQRKEIRNELTEENDYLKSFIIDLTNTLDHVINLQCVIDVLVDSIGWPEFAAISNMIVDARDITDKE